MNNYCVFVAKAEKLTNHTTSYLNKVRHNCIFSVKTIRLAVNCTTSNHRTSAAATHSVLSLNAVNVLIITGRNS